MNFDEVVISRRSIRRYQDRSIPEGEIEALLELARHAPSSMNGQPWHFVVVKDAGTKAALAEIKNRFCPTEKRAFQADFMRSAAAIVVICVELSRSFGREIENGILAASTLMLAAQSRGLGSVYMSAYIPDEPQLSHVIREVLGVPQAFAPISMLPLGYPDEVPPPKVLTPLKEIIHFEQF